RGEGAGPLECPDPSQCAERLIDWIKARIASSEPASAPVAPRSQAVLWKVAPYLEEAPAIRTPAELAGAIEHLGFAVFRRYQNILTRAERARLDNTIDNALFKVERYLARLEGDRRTQADSEVTAIRDAVREGRERSERLRHQARRADLKLSQLDTLT